MRRRLSPLVPALAAMLADAAGAHGLAFYLLLAAVVAAAASALEVVGLVAEERRSRASAAVAGLTLVLVVTAASARTPEIALGCLVLIGLEELALLLSRRPLPEAEKAI